jgi:hypothetical protein
VGLANVAARCRRGRFSRTVSGERVVLAPPIRSLAGRGVLVAPFVLLLSACGGPSPQKPADSGAATENQAFTAPQPEIPKFDCAAPGSTEFAPVCTIDRTETPNGTILTLRRPDGGFHRLLITRDGRGVIAADGAEPAKVTPLAADRIEVEVGGARYRLPATVRGPAPQ